MRNAMQLKAIINNIAKERGIRPQLALQNYMLERFLDRVSLSQYRLYDGKKMTYSLTQMRKVKKVFI